MDGPTLCSFEKNVRPAGRKFLLGRLFCTYVQAHMSIIPVRHFTLLPPKPVLQSPQDGSTMKRQKKDRATRLVQRAVPIPPPYQFPHLWLTTLDNFYLSVGRAALVRKVASCAFPRRKHQIHYQHQRHSPERSKVLAAATTPKLV